MATSSIGSLLKAQLTKYSPAVNEGLSRPQPKFVHQMLYGVQAAQDVKLSAIARSLQENIAFIKTEDRLSRNLGGGKPFDQGAGLYERIYGTAGGGGWCGRLHGQARHLDDGPRR